MDFEKRWNRIVNKRAKISSNSLTISKISNGNWHITELGSMTTLCKNSSLLHLLDSFEAEIDKALNVIREGYVSKINELDALNED